jgi:DNA primase
MRRFSEDELFAIRNQVPMRAVIIELSGLPNKEIEGVFRFLCPFCNEFQTGVHEKTNLARCFRCCRNFNTIELLMASRALSFVESVKLLLRQRDSAHPAVPVAFKRHATRDAGTASSADTSSPARSFLSAVSILANRRAS